MKIIKINDTITYRPSFGSGPLTKAKVVGLTVTDLPRDKYGEEVDEVSVDLVKQNRVLFDLDNNHWAYSDQICLTICLTLMKTALTD